MACPYDQLQGSFSKSIYPLICIFNVFFYKTSCQSNAAKHHEITSSELPVFQILSLQRLPCFIQALMTHFFSSLFQKLMFPLPRHTSFPACRCFPSCKNLPKQPFTHLLYNFQPCNQFLQPLHHLKIPAGTAESSPGTAPSFNYIFCWSHGS